MWSRSSSADQRARMVKEQLRGRGIHSESVLEVMGELPRELFLPPEQRNQAYRDQAVPLPEGQTISQPYMVAIMTEALDLESTDRVLEVGTGSGYQAAVLSRLATEVLTVERLPSLAARAESTLKELGCDNVRILVGDGTLGWPEEAPFDAILVTAGAPAVPESLKRQLTEEGRLVAPVGDRYLQELVRVTRHGSRFETEGLLACRFVPLVGREGWEGS